MKKPIIVILAAALVFAAGPGARSAQADDPAGGKQELRRIKREMREKKKKIRRAGTKERSILTDLDRIDREIQEAKAELAGHRSRVEEAEAALKKAEEEQERIGRALAGLKPVYAERLRALYKMSRHGDAAAVLVSSGPGDEYRRMKYLGAVAERDRALLRDYGSAIDALAVTQADIAERKTSLLGRERTLEEKSGELESRKRKKAVLLASVRREKGVYEETLRELEESSANLWSMIRKAEQERKVVQAKTVRPAHEGTGSLPWPVEGRVLTHFGMQRHPEFKTMVFRRGIEIEVREGEPVKAVAEGQVAYADWYKGYGELVIIEHGPGYYTLYGNLSKLDLAKGDRVVRGQEIGLAGETGSTKGAKLYFEIRRNGEAQDPLRWLARR